MKSLVVEDDFTSRFILQSILSTYGECSGVPNGKDALHVYQAAKHAGEPFDLICLDIVMPEMNGQDVLVQIRKLEESENPSDKEKVKVIMTSAPSHFEGFSQDQRNLSNAYLAKPINKAKLLNHLKSFGLI